VHAFFVFQSARCATARSTAPSFPTGSGDTPFGYGVDLVVCVCPAGPSHRTCAPVVSCFFPYSFFCLFFNSPRFLICGCGDCSRIQMDSRQLSLFQPFLTTFPLGPTAQNVVVRSAPCRTLISPSIAFTVFLLPQNDEAPATLPFPLLFETPTGLLLPRATHSPRAVYDLDHPHPCCHPPRLARIPAVTPALPEVRRPCSLMPLLLGQRPSS